MESTGRPSVNFRVHPSSPRLILAGLCPSFALVSSYRRATGAESWAVVRQKMDRVWEVVVIDQRGGGGPG